MREAQVNLAIRWFVGYALHEALPDHSSLTRIRQRWGEDVFRQVFTRVVRQCQQAGMISAETVHIDASLIRANVSMTHWFCAIWMRSRRPMTTPMVPSGMRARAASSRSLPHDSDATMATSSKARCAPPTNSTRPLTILRASLSMWRSLPAKNMTRAGSTCAWTPSQRPSGSPQAGSRRTRIYGVGRVYAALEDRRIEAVIPPLRSPRRQGAQGFPTERFKFDPHHDVVRCPAKKRLTARNQHEIGSMVSREPARLRALFLKTQCLPQGTPSRGSTS